MKRLFGSLFVITLLVAASAAQKPDSSKAPDAKPVASPAVKLPSAKDVLDKYVKAIGGRDALLKHKSRYQTGSVELTPMGVKGTMELISVSDGRSFTKVALEGVGDLLDGFDGTTAWTSNPVQGSRVKEGKELIQSKRLGVFGREVKIDSMYSPIVVRGIEKVGDRDTYVVVCSTEGLPDDILYFDTETGLMLRSDGILLAPEGQQAFTTFYEDYRDVDGIKSAFRTRAKAPAFEINTVLSEIKYDVTIDDAKFKRPN
jgi:hypothetical protein